MVFWFLVNFMREVGCYSEKAMAPHSSTLAWKIPWMEEPGMLQSVGSLESDTTERLHFHFSLSCIGEGNGNPLQCSCLENPRDGGAWWAAVYGVAQSQTWLKQLSSRSSSRMLLSPQNYCDFFMFFLLLPVVFSLLDSIWFRALWYITTILSLWNLLSIKIHDRFCPIPCLLSWIPLV